MPRYDSNWEFISAICSEAAPGEDPTALLNRTLSCSDAYSTTSREVAQVIVDEENQAGRVSYSDLAEYFSYSFGGMWGVVIVFLAHIFINGQRR